MEKLALLVQVFIFLQLWSMAGTDLMICGNSQKRFNENRSEKPNAQIKSKIAMFCKTIILIIDCQEG